MNVIKIFFHLIPLIGVYLGRPYLILSLALLVTLPYIKVKKLSLVLEELEANGSNLSEDSKNRTRSALNFWKKITFLKP